MDRAVFEAWSHTLGVSLEEKGLTVLPMGGGAHAARHAPIRTEILTGVSNRTGIPHLFVLDRDERGQQEIAGLTEQLGNRLHVFTRREIENYLLDPTAILAAIRDKHRDDAQIRERVEAARSEDITEAIEEAASGLFGLVLMKRIRAEVGGLRDGFLPRDKVSRLAAHARQDDLPDLVLRSIEATSADRIAELNVVDLVRTQREELERDWADASKHVLLAPGEEIVTRVFGRFGARYSKRTDAVRIAEAMSIDAIDPRGGSHHIASRWIDRNPLGLLFSSFHAISEPDAEPDGWRCPRKAARMLVHAVAFPVPGSVSSRSFGSTPSAAASLRIVLG